MSGGIEIYADSDVNPRPAGIVAVGKQANNVLKALLLDDSGNLQVNVVASIPVINTSDPYRGTSTYSGGTSGTVVIPAGGRVVSLSAHATVAGTLIIFGGQSVPVPANNGFSDGWSGFVGPGTIVFVGTDSYYVVVNI